MTASEPAIRKWGIYTTLTFCLDESVKSRYNISYIRDLRCTSRILGTIVLWTSKTPMTPTRLSRLRVLMTKIISAHPITFIIERDGTTTIGKPNERRSDV